MLPLAEVAERIAVRNKGGIENVMTASAVHGLVSQERFFTKRIAATDTSTYLVVEPGDLVYNKSTSKDAPFGAILRHTGPDAGVVTPLYIVFRAHEDRVSAEFLRLACNSDAFFGSLRESLREGARTHGLLNVRLKEFFSASVPVPDAPTQHRVVDLLTAAEAVVEESKRELAAAQRALQVARNHHVGRLWQSAPLVALGDVLQETKRPITVEADVSYDQIGIRSHGRGVFTKEAVTGAELGSKKVYWIEPGDLVINIVFAWEGAVAVVPKEIDGYCGSHRFPTYRRRDEGSIEYIRHCLLSDRGIDLLGMASPGGAGRNRTLNRTTMLRSSIPLPSVDEQERLSSALTAFEDYVTSASIALDATVRMKDALLSNVFAGRLCITPSYEDNLSGKVVS